MIKIFLAGDVKAQNTSSWQKMSVIEMIITLAGLGWLFCGWLGGEWLKRSMEKSHYYGAWDIEDEILTLILAILFGPIFLLTVASVIANLKPPSLGHSLFDGNKEYKEESTEQKES